MSDFPINPTSGSLANDQPLAVTGIWPDTAAMRAPHTIVSGIFRPQQELPIYCNPIALFFAVWILMLACLSVHVSYVIYPYFGIPFLIFVVSAGSLLLGYFASKAILERGTPQIDSISYGLDVTRLWRLNLLFSVFALALIGLNWFTSGPPPAIGDPSTYLTYGKLKQILFPLLICIAVNATFDSSRLRRSLFQAFSIGILILYISRGALLNTFLQIFFVFSMRTSMKKRKQYLLAIGAFAFAAAAFTMFGNLRTAHDAFIAFLQIREKYSNWPTVFLWVVSYISIPFSNLCWMVAHPPSHGPTFAFLNSLLPSFMAQSNPYAGVSDSMNIIDNASTYLKAYALDFCYLGIYFTNLLIGIGCGWLARRSYPRHILILAIFLTSISLLFFTDMFFQLSTVVEVCIQVLVMMRCFQWEA